MSGASDLPLLSCFLLSSLSYSKLSCKLSFDSLGFGPLLGFGLLLSLYSSICCLNILLGAGQCGFCSFTQSLCNLTMGCLESFFILRAQMMACSCHSAQHDLFYIYMYVTNSKVMVGFLLLRLKQNIQQQVDQTSLHMQLCQDAGI